MQVITMTGNGDLRRMEARLFSSYFQDGAWDVMIGILMLAMAVRTFIDHWTISLLGLGGVLYVVLLRMFVTRKRLGVAQFSASRKKKRTRMLFIILAANLVTLVLFLSALLGAHPSKALSAAVIVLLVVLTFSLVAYFMDYWRFFIWGALLAGTILIMELYGEGAGSWVSLVIGSLITLAGIYYLVSFMKKYPLTGGDGQ